MWQILWIHICHDPDSKLYIEDIVDEFCDDFIVPCVQAGAVYEHKYLLGTSMARPAIAKKLVEIARKEGAVAICHGATGKGNDQIRFELGIKALAPDIKIIAPWRMTDKWTMQSREDEIAFCKAHGIDLPFDASHSYSRDRNLWHISHEGLELEDPSQAPNYDNMLVLGVTPEKAPDKETEVTMTFEQPERLQRQFWTLCETGISGSKKTSERMSQSTSGY